MLSDGYGALLTFRGGMGTRVHSVNIWDVDPSTTDAERAANHVPLLHEQLKQAERWTLELGQPSQDAAPEWMKEALERWEREDS